MYVRTPTMFDLRTEGDHADRDQRDGDRKEWRQQVEERVDVRRDEAFLREQLDDVGERLQQPMRPDAIRAEAKLDVREHLALDPLQIRQRGHEHGMRPDPF